MALTGMWVVGVVTAVTVLTFGAAVWLLPRWSGSGWRPVLARIGVLAVVNVSMLLTVTVALNASFGFFADWTDLLGAAGLADGGNRVVTVSGGGEPGAAVGQDPGPWQKPPGQNAPGQDGPRQTGKRPISPSEGVDQGGLQTSHRSPGDHGRPPLPAGTRPEHPITYTITGARSGITSRVVVELPESYFDPRQPHRLFPVIETFHGYPGLPDQWIAGMALGTTWRTERQAGAIGDAIIVSPNLEIPSGVDSECVDGGSAGPAVETWMSQDVPDWVLATFRARSDRRSWATVGLSAGGWCAALAVMHHPDRYSAAIVLGGYFRPIFSGYTPFTPTSPSGQRYDLVAQASHAPPPVALWVQTSKADQLSFSTSAALIAAARVPLSVRSTVLLDAGHRFSVWRGLVPGALQWLGRTVPGFAASAPVAGAGARP